MVPDALAWQGHGREGAGGGAPTVAGARGGCLLADGARHGRGQVLLSRTRFDRVLSSLRLPISGAVVLWGLQIVPLGNTGRTARQGQ